MPNFAFVGVGDMVPRMVRAMQDITKTTNITKKRGLLLALFMGEKSRKGRSKSRRSIKLKATKPQNLLGIDLKTS